MLAPDASVGPVETTVRAENVGFAERILSVYVVDIWLLPAGKFVHAIRTRPLAGSTSISSLSAKSTASPASSICPEGFEAGVTSTGPVHVCPQSVDRWIASVPTSP